MDQPHALARAGDSEVIEVVISRHEHSASVKSVALRTMGNHNTVLLTGLKSRQISGKAEEAEPLQAILGIIKLVARCPLSPVA